jgi:hypothetical protein
MRIGYWANRLSIRFCGMFGLMNHGAARLVGRSPWSGPTADVVEDCRARFLPSREIWLEAGKSWDDAVKRFPSAFVLPYAVLRGSLLSPLDVCDRQDDDRINR